ncbi:N-alpha-acetyltransferase 50-like [Petromyzon marinus]|uniref:N-alpha-acetyltransferase 50-like n=1 Tax=Petromyzon marinus TaxID=7757 RepID=UPI003F7119C1
MGGSPVDLQEVTALNVQALRRLHQAVFPVPYGEAFYRHARRAGPLARAAYVQGAMVGSVCCRWDTSEDRRRLYIMTLGTLPTYRRLGIGSALLRYVLGLCEAECGERVVSSVYLHVQVGNEDALCFYGRFGFLVTGKACGYYPRQQHADAWVLERTLTDS